MTFTLSGIFHDDNKDIFVVVCCYLKKERHEGAVQLCVI